MALVMKACIFDLDGTLGDTRESLVYSVGRTLKEMGLPGITREECIRFVGNGARCLMERALEASGAGNEVRIEEGMEVYDRIFDEFCTYQVKAYEGIGELLGRLKEKGLLLAVLSNKPHRQTLKVVRAMYGEDVFSYVQGRGGCENREECRAENNLCFLGISDKRRTNSSRSGIYNR